MSRAAAALALVVGIAFAVPALTATEALAAASKKRAPAAAAPAPAPLGEAERVAGQKAFEAGDYPRAAELLEKGWELGKQPKVLFTLGECQRKLGNWEKAAFWFGRYLALAPRPIADEEAARTLLSEMQLKADVEKKATPQIVVAQPAEPVPASALPDAPAPVTPPAVEKEGGVHTQWWFWTVLGAVVVGGAVTGAVVATQQHGKTPTTLGELQW
ncbi:MAG: tetratricopeptide repeat protein [Myxococcales bacterium]